MQGEFLNRQRLNQCAYLGGVLIVVGVWLIGTRIGNTWITLVTTLALSLFFALESYRIQKNDPPKIRIKNKKLASVLATLVLWIFFMSMLLTMHALLGNNHSDHHSDTSAHSTH